MKGAITFYDTSSNNPKDALNVRTEGDGIVIDTEGDDHEQVLSRKEAEHLYQWLRLVLELS